MARPDGHATNDSRMEHSVPPVQKDRDFASTIRMAQRFDNEDFRDSTMRFPNATLPVDWARAAGRSGLRAACPGARRGRGCAARRVRRRAEARREADRVRPRARDERLLGSVPAPDGRKPPAAHARRHRQPAGVVAGRPPASRSSARASTGTASLYVANADGSGERVLPDSVSGPIDWSPDGRRLLYVDDGRIYVTNEDWTRAPAAAGSASAARRRRALVARRPADLVRARRRPRRRRLGDGRGRRRPAAAHPPGARLGVPRLADLVARRRAARVPAPGQPRRRRRRRLRATGALTRFPRGIFPSTPAWSPDGETIAYARLKLGRAAAREAGSTSSTSDDGEVQRLTREIDSSPSWSPDGRQIVFQRLTGFHISEITLMDRDGSNQVEPDDRRLVGLRPVLASRRRASDCSRAPRRRLRERARCPETRRRWTRCERWSRCATIASGPRTRPRAATLAGDQPRPQRGGHDARAGDAVPVGRGRCRSAPRRPSDPGAARARRPRLPASGPHARGAGRADPGAGRPRRERCAQQPASLVRESAVKFRRSVADQGISRPEALGVLTTRRRHPRTEPHPRAGRALSSTAGTAAPLSVRSRSRRAGSRRRRSPRPSRRRRRS